MKQQAYEEFIDSLDFLSANLKKAFFPESSGVVPHTLPSLFSEKTTRTTAVKSSELQNIWRHFYDFCKKHKRAVYENNASSSSFHSSKLKGDYEVILKDLINLSKQVAWRIYQTKDLNFTIVISLTDYEQASLLSIACSMNALAIPAPLYEATANQSSSMPPLN